MPFINKYYFVSGQSVAPLSKPLSFQRIYDQVSADIHFICPAIELAQTMALSFARSNVYMYIGTHNPTVPVCTLDLGDNYCPQFAFHWWDFRCLTQNVVPLGILPLGSSDISFGNLLMDRFVMMADSPDTPIAGMTLLLSRLSEGYVVNLMDQTNTPTTNWKKEICEQWFSFGFYNYTILN